MLIGGFLLLTQISCQKSVAQTNGNQTVVQANLILLGKVVQIVVSPAVKNDTGAVIKPEIDALFTQYSVANIDGSNKRQIPITLPAGLYTGVFTGGYTGGIQAYLTPNGQTIVFTATNQSGTVRAVYSCAIDGSNLKKLMDTDSQTQLLGAY